MAYYPRFIGGAEVSIKEITSRLSHEYDFHLITLRYDKNLPRTSREGKVFVHRIGPGFSNTSVADLRKIPFRLLKIYFQFAAFRSAHKLHRTEHFDAVWGMMAHSAGVPVALFKRYNRRVPYVLTLQEGDPLDHIERQMSVFGSLFRNAFVRADIVQAISVFLGDWGVKMGARKVVIIPNGVDIQHFGAAIERQVCRSIRTQFSIPDDAFLLATASRLVPKNGVDIVIRALRFLPKNTHFLIAGAGSQRSNLEKLAASEGVSSRIHFAGEISQQELPSYLKSADLFVRASRSEGMGNAFIEAMAAGLPVVGTNVGGIPDFLHEGKTGFVAEECDPKSVAGAILRAQENKMATTQIAEAGRLQAQAYHWDILALRMKEEVFEPLWQK